MGLFGKEKDAKEVMREMQRKLRQEQRALDRQIHGIQREEAKVTKQIKEAARKGDKDVCRILAKEMVQSRRAQNKIHVSKAQINSVIMSMQQQVSVAKMAGSIQTSAEVMKSMQSLVKVPEIAATMRAMSKEMMKAGIMEEMIEDTMEMMEPDDMEEEVEKEVDKVLYEVTAGMMGEAPAVPIGGMSVAPHEEESIAAAVAPKQAQAEMVEEDLLDRLDALRS